MNWLIARFHDKSTQIGLPLILALAVVIWAIARFGYGVHFLPQHALAPLGTMLAAFFTPDSAAFKIVKPVVKAWLSAFLSPFPVKSKERPMSVVSTISEVLAEAPDFIKIAQDGVAIVQAIESKNFATIVAGFPGYEADLVKVYNDIKALGVSQAVAAGTVTPVQ